MTANAEMIEYWNGPVGERWARLQETMDVSLSEIHQALMTFANPRPRERVLDIGCGTGTTTYALAKAVGNEGSVTGVDISEPMLAVARGRGVGVNFRKADAATHLFHPTHDLVFSRFGVMFFDDPVRAFANIKKAINPHGRMSFVCWREMAKNLWAAAPFEAARGLLPPQTPADPLAPGPFAFADADRLGGILAKAGYRDVRIEQLDTVVRMGATPADAAVQSLNIGPLAFAAKDADGALRAGIVAAVEDTLRKFTGEKGVAPPAACWLVRAAP
ncbi:MAG TPA: methyltransferase domain-containing protein [Rhizomicrobium sp.]|nr:methyltransferase domain-containing protein [Rhizomicrobium sp.]